MIEGREDTKSPFGVYRPGWLVRWAWRLADQHSLSDAVRRTVRSVVARLFGGPYDLSVEGLKFRLYPAENYDDRKILAKGRLPEKAERKLLAPFLKAGGTFVDVGANVGSYALFAAHHGMDVLAVEANPSTAERLKFNVAANDMDEVRVVEMAVGPEAGELTLWYEPTNRGFATAVKDLADEWRADWAPRKVSMQTLKDVLESASIEGIHVLKLDVEGFEDRVVLPYLRATGKSLWPRVILLETNCRPHWVEDCLTELERHGYRRVGETEDNAVLELAA